MTIREEIWQLTQDVAIIEKAKSRIKTNPHHPEYWIAVKRNVEELLKPRKKSKPKTGLCDELYQRYRNAKYEYEKINFPNWIKDGHFIEPENPDVGTSNGLQDFIIQYLTWLGQRATRINVMGRQIGDTWIPSSTRKGTADVSSTINGRSVQWEIKIGADKPSEAQLKEQAKERKAGGEYFFVKTAEEFFILYDSLFKQKTLF